MRILFLSHYFPPEGNAPATRTHQNCREWVRAGHEVTVITCAPNVPSGRVYEGYRNRLTQREVVDGIEVIRIWTYLAPNAGTVRRILNYLSFMVIASLRGLFTERPDVLIATSPQFFCGWAGTILAFLRRIPFVLEIRDIWPESIQAVGAMKASLATRFLEWMERTMYRSADRIVTVGPGYKRQLEARGVPAGMIDVVPNGADLDGLKAGPPDPGFVARHGLEGRFTVGYVGTIGMACGLDVVLDAARILRSENDESIRLLLIGDGARREELERQVVEERLDNVIITGRIDKTEIPGVLNSLDACLVHLKKLPLFETVLPSKMFEAFAVEKPIILGVKGDAAEVLEAAQAGIAIEPESASDLIQAIRTLQADPDKASAMGRNGRQFVATHYDRKVLATAGLDVLQRTITDGDAEPSPSRSTAATPSDAL